jgi:acyl-coenzyme A synthetase/AMP-(fatty) acid ligase
VNFVEPILRQARLQPAAPAVIERERTTTYAELVDRILRTAGHLASLGIRPGDFLGLSLKDDSDHIVILLAVSRVGAIPIEIDWRSRPTERARVVNAFNPKVVIAAPGIEIGGSCPIIVLDQAWNAAVACAQHAIDLPMDWHAPAAILGSSGTTGLPNFTMATHLQLYLHAAAYLEMVPPTRRHRYLQTFPLYFSSGRKACLAYLMRGDTVILYPSLFSATEFMEAIRRLDVTIAFVAPSVVRQLLQTNAGPAPLFPEMDFLMSVGAPLFPEEKCAAIRELTPRFHEFYGATAIGPISILRPSDISERPTSVGRPLALIDVEVVDEDECPLGPDAPGRLRCRGPGLTSPVTGAGHSSAEDFRDGWHYPGELASIDPLGYIRLQGRTSEVIYRGGAKVFPAEVEAVLQAHDAVAESAVVAIRSPENEKEQVLVAYVTCRRELTQGELVAHCRTHLTAFKVPREINVVSALPKNSSGKLDKRALRLLAETR